MPPKRRPGVRVVKKATDKSKKRGPNTNLMAKRMLEALGMEDLKAKIEPPKPPVNNGDKDVRKFRPVEESQIQAYREIQGIAYFLQAPKLFTQVTCRECNTPFLVSRKFVLYCGYPCMMESMRKQGLEWSKQGDLEAVAMDPQVWDGNEPLIIKNLDQLKKALEALCSVQNDQPLSV